MKHLPPKRTTDPRSVAPEPRYGRPGRSLGNIADRKIPERDGPRTCDWMYEDDDAPNGLRRCGKPAYYFFGSGKVPRFYDYRHGRIIIERGDKFKAADKRRKAKEKALTQSPDHA